MGSSYSRLMYCISKSARLKYCISKSALTKMTWHEEKSSRVYLHSNLHWFGGRCGQTSGVISNLDMGTMNLCGCDWVRKRDWDSWLMLERLPVNCISHKQSIARLPGIKLKAFRIEQYTAQCQYANQDKHFQLDCSSQYSQRLKRTQYSIRLLTTQLHYTLPFHLNPNLQPKSIFTAADPSRLSSLLCRLFLHRFGVPKQKFSKKLKNTPIQSWITNKGIENERLEIERIHTFGGVVRGLIHRFWAAWISRQTWPEPFHGLALSGFRVRFS